MSNTLLDRVRQACKADPNIVVPINKVINHPGFELSYLEILGLDKRDLKKLERLGQAIRGYSKNFWIAGETTPDGTDVKENQIYTGPGHTVRWLLVTKESYENAGAMQDLPPGKDENIGED